MWTVDSFENVFFVKSSRVLYIDTDREQMQEMNREHFVNYFKNNPNDYLRNMITNEPVNVSELFA